MKEIKILIIISLAIIMATSCTKKIHTNEVSFKKDSVYYDNKPFTGEIWTDDDKTGSFNTDNGVLKSLKFYHDNGKVAVAMEIKNNGKPETHVYDDKGNSTDLVSFQQKYTDLWIKIALVQGEFMSK
ncbi:hypothetical protein [Prevotella sp.]|jgi:hypothetical protein|uniref:hypothetical protein n=1 Tax=Prevotella sp. TaxID=59823 RepID=UPI003DA29DBC